MEVQQDSVPQHRSIERADILVSDVVAALHQRPRLGGQYQELRGSYAGAVVHIFLDEIGGAFVSGRVARTRSMAWRATLSPIGTMRTRLLEIQNLFGVGDRIGMVDVE